MQNPREARAHLACGVANFKIHFAFKFGGANGELLQPQIQLPLRWLSASPGTLCIICFKCASLSRQSTKVSRCLHFRVNSQLYTATTMQFPFAKASGLWIFCPRRSKDSGKLWRWKRAKCLKAREWQKIMYFFQKFYTDCVVLNLEEWKKSSNVRVWV